MSEDSPQTSLEDFMPQQYIPLEIEEPEIPEITGDPQADLGLYQIQRYAKSEKEDDRNFFAKKIAEIAIDLGCLAPERLLPVIEDLMKDEESVRNSLTKQLVKLFDVLEGQYDFLLNSALKFIKAEIYCDDQYSQKLACDAFEQISMLIKDEDKGLHVLTFLLNLAHEDEDEELRMLSLRMCDKHAPTLGRDLCEMFVTTEFISLADDQRFKVRSTVAGSIVNLSRTVSPQIFNRKLLPVYLKLANDPIWKVRKSVVESIAGIAQVSTSEVRREKLMPLFEKAIIDESRWVKTAACQQLGPFVAVMYNESAQPELINRYIDIIRNTGEEGSQSQDMIYQCAYNFPAVLVTVGADQWDNHLKEIYQILAKNDQVRVRKTLISQIVEIARHIGPELTESDLMRVFQIAFMDDEIDIRKSAIQHLAGFVQLCGEPARFRCLYIIDDLYKPDDPWRVRVEILEQLQQLIEYYSDEIVAQKILPIMVTMTDDKVYAVKNRAAQAIGVLLLRLLPNESLRPQLAELINSYVCDTNFTKRKLAVTMLYTVSQNFQLFMDHWNLQFDLLCNDKQSNVRILCAKLVAKDWALNYMDSCMHLYKEMLLIDDEKDIRDVTSWYDKQQSRKCSIATSSVSSPSTPASPELADTHYSFSESREGNEILDLRKVQSSPSDASDQQVMEVEGPMDDDVKKTLSDTQLNPQIYVYNEEGKETGQESTLI